MKRSLSLSVGTGLAIALFLWLSLEASDAIFQARLLPWIGPIIYLQDIGFRMAARFFPCQKEGFDTGCEAYKTIPVFLSTNALLYSIISLPVIYFRPMNTSMKGLTPIASDRRILSNNVRLLAGATGCVSGIALLGVSWVLSLFGILLIASATAVSWLPRVGRWLVFGAAVLVSVLILPVCLSNPVEMLMGPFAGPHDLGFLVMSIAWLLSPVLLIWCDVLLFIDVIRAGRARGR